MASYDTKAATNAANELQQETDNQPNETPFFTVIHIKKHKLMTCNMQKQENINRIHANDVDNNI
ncbi:MULTISPECIES: hypothetical protein [Vibrio]|uniref:Uncharacterized protein n=1 Tax=Vibrio furnissii TaxID=29494 RepID=A0A0Q2Y126_VIBFU|nr:hypothetical protein [Vibrio furnissii]KQH86356.1 hypothetical protein AMR76_10005 [Vibrio furnissii]MCG6230505.1 hypothetical protein [Vibrio furnissii]TRN19292.1 hypothetical protein DM784_22185 [Vibrio furnissii]